MIKHIVVALDGSQLAEAALLQAKAIARLYGARVTLLHVIEPDPPTTVHGERHLSEPEEAEDYLRELAEQLANEGVPTSAHVHCDSIAPIAGGIVAHEEELRPDLIVMCTHGPDRLERMLRGCVAQQVVSLGSTPLLLVSAEDRTEKPVFEYRKILVALDGNEQHEAGFGLACDIAAKAGARLHLLSIVARFFHFAGRRASVSRYLPGANWFMQSLASDQLRNYLGELMVKAEAAGIETTAEIQHGRIARSIRDKAEELDASLIVLTTHGKAGAEAFWANSIAAKVQMQTQRPLLLVPV